MGVAISLAVPAALSQSQVALAASQQSGASATEDPLNLKPMKVDVKSLRKAYQQRAAEVGAPKIVDIPAAPGTIRQVKFDSDYNVEMELWLAPFKKGESLTLIRMLTRHKGGEMFGDVGMLWAAYAVALSLHPKANKAEVQQLLRDLQIATTNQALVNACSAPIVKRFQGIEYRRLPKSATTRATLEIYAAE
jgi:hypothetical protein